MGSYEETDITQPEANSGPERRPIFGKKLPFGLRISEIKSGSRQPRTNDPDLQKINEDVFTKFKLVAQELLALWDILFREGIIDDHGMNADNKPGEKPTGPDVFFSGGGYPPWWGAFLGWLKFWMDNQAKLIAIIKWLVNNKQRGGEAVTATYGVVWEWFEQFNKGNFFDKWTLDSSSQASLTIPGCLVADDLPVADNDHAWMHRIYANLANAGKMHVVNTPGSFDCFWRASDFGSGVYAVPVGPDVQIAPDPSIAAAGLNSVFMGSLFTSFMLGAFNKTIYTDGTGAINYVSHDIADKLYTSNGIAVAPSWKSPTFKDTNIRILNQADTSKKLAFACGQISPATTRTMTLPDRDIPQASFVHIGAAAPTVGEGQLWYNTTLDELFVYEATRTKWLSVAERSADFAHGSGAIGDTFLRMMESIPPGGAVVTGEHMLWDATVVAIWVRLKTAAAADIPYQIAKNGVTVLGSVTILNGTSYITSTSLDIDLSAGDTLAVYQNCPGATTTDRPHCRIFFKRRTA